MKGGKEKIRKLQSFPVNLKVQVIHVFESSGTAYEEAIMSHYSVHTDKLTKENYDTWAIQMKAILTQNDQWVYVSGLKIKPEEEDQATVWDKTDRKAGASIILSISTSQICYVKHCETSRETWEKLQTVYSSKGPAKKASPLKQLLFTKLKEGESMIEHLNSFFNLVDKLSEMDTRMSEDLLVILLIYSIPDSYATFRCAIEARDELPRLETLRIKLIEEAQTRNEETGKIEQGALYIKEAKARPKVEFSKQNNHKYGNKYKCHYCHKIGHKASECWKRNDDRKQNTEYANRRQSASHAEETLLTTNEQSIKTVECAMSVDIQTSKCKDTRWCLDSGATAHMCHDESSFINLNYTSDQDIKLATDKTIRAQGSGTVCLNTKRGQVLQKVCLENTLYVPELRTNLLSVMKAAEKGKKIMFTNDSASILNLDGTPIIRAKKNGNLYYVREENTKEAAMVTSTPSNLLLWHMRYGHLNENDLKKLERMDMVKGLHFKNKDEMPFCDICAKCKQTVLPFKTNKNKKPVNMLDLVHSDVCGPIQTTSNGGSRYFITFTDEHSNRVEVYFLKSKAEAK